jgi:hypothetical protein
MCENRTHLDVNESIQMKRIKIKIEDDFKWRDGMLKAEQSIKKAQCLPKYQSLKTKMSWTQRYKDKTLHMLYVFPLDLSKYKSQWPHVTCSTICK